MIEIKLEKYQHYKGGIYEVIGIARHSETLEGLVIYKNQEGEFWVRPKEMFLETVETESYRGSRFIKVKEQ